MAEQNWKGMLQERLLKDKLAPRYNTWRHGGSEHQPSYTCSLLVGKQEFFGKGSSKKDAEKAAAKAALFRLDELSGSSEEDTSLDALQMPPHDLGCSLWEPEQMARPPTGLNLIVEITPRWLRQSILPSDGLECCGLLNESRSFLGVSEIAQLPAWVLPCHSRQMFINMVFLKIGLFAGREESVYLYSETLNQMPLVLAQLKQHSHHLVVLDKFPEKMFIKSI